ncbi:hypothetical protein J2S00_002645 [Caldalkalibacillus uzonensis]|uniref:Uncharacterized protein n=1 Tax=Caldalkalibacillus uzonensis TaxID=353224 RepID=A0ABU0CUQ5_9BACI|nr:hypothetical protein [Caldalkalibacillus uzonensis]
MAVNGLIDEDAIRDSVLTALQGEAKESSEDLFSHIKNRISLRQIEETTNLREGIHQLLTGPPCS